jgi:hypothetical protein
MKYIELGGHFKYSLQGARPQSGSCSPCDRWNPTRSISPSPQAAVSPYTPVSLGSVIHTWVEGEENTHTSVSWLRARPQLGKNIQDAQKKKQNTVYNYKSTHSSTYATGCLTDDKHFLLPYGLNLYFLRKFKPTVDEWTVQQKLFGLPNNDCKIFILYKP